MTAEELELEIQELQKTVKALQGENSKLMSNYQTTITALNSIGQTLELVRKALNGG